jgi:hypothetical protein
VEQGAGAPELRPVQRGRATEDALGVVTTDDAEEVLALVPSGEERDAALDDAGLALGVAGTGVSGVSFCAVIVPPP